jgi:hypothetical protein
LLCQQCFQAILNTTRMSNKNCDIKAHLQNGIVESATRAISESARTMLLHSK